MGVSRQDNPVSPTAITDLSAATSWMTRLRANDERARRQLVRVFGPLIYQWARQFGASSEDAPAIMQRVFGDLLSEAVGSDAIQKGGNLRRRLRGLTFRRVRDQHRQALRETVSFEEQGTETGTQRISAANDEAAPPDSTPADLHLLVHGALHSLREEFPSLHWQAFWRTTVKQEHSRDVARDLNVAQVVMYQARSRVLRRLRQFLLDIGEIRT